MSITDHHDMTLAVKGALNRNTTNQPNPNPTNNVVFCLQLLREGTISQRIIEVPDLIIYAHL